MHTTTIRNNATGRPMTTSTVPMTIFLVLIAVLRCGRLTAKLSGRPHCRFAELERTMTWAPHLHATMLHGPLQRVVRHHLPRVVLPRDCENPCDGNGRQHSDCCAHES